MKKILTLAAALVLAAGFSAGCEEFTSFTCQLDGGPQVRCTSPVRYDDLPPGPHTVVVCGRNHERRDDGWVASAEGCDSRSWVVLPPA